MQKTGATRYAQSKMYTLTFLNKFKDNNSTTAASKTSPPTCALENLTSYALNAQNLQAW